MRWTAWIVMALANAGCVYGGAGPTGTSTQHLEGSLGNVNSFTTDQFQIQNNTASNVRIDALGDSWWVMNTLSFSPSLNDASWSPGTTRSYVSTAYGSSTSNVTVLGCSGPSYEHWTYDRTADRVDVHVEQGSAPNVRVVSYTAYWNDASNSYAVSGSFEHTIP
jgi:hypothetical protein